ncbi:MAG TPA: ATP synthase F0 subunit B [Bryobacteraceae bacterium]|jgi:F-type H+-transporting ATPase subunit b|nr:ATP synthase F0 subunit B [Bryobacteraceae bacterium]
MEQTLTALGGILQKAIPTILLILILHFYFKRVLFRPLERALAERDEATVGARRAAEESLRRAEQKAAEYEEAIRAARADAYREQDQIRRQLAAEQESRIQAIRKSLDDMVREAKARIEQEAEAARQTVMASAASLAEEIADTVLVGRRG